MPGKVVSDLKTVWITLRFQEEIVKILIFLPFHLECHGTEKSIANFKNI